jgi:hypothetical protein
LRNEQTLVEQRYRRDCRDVASIVLVGEAREILVGQGKPMCGRAPTLGKSGWEVEADDFVDESR